ncbi:MAG: GGDEF domain-containing protein [Lachnospiraceae bacterium]|nr:GGDEF domain-containing protein [Lachnospiraceae bacterium]
MNVDRLVNKFIDSGIGEFLITDTKWNLLYKAGNIRFEYEKWKKWTKRFHGEPTEGLDIEWEIAEKESSVYFSVISREVTDENDRYLVHFIYDISDLAGLFHDVTSYSREWHMLSKCQGDLISAMSEGSRAVLPIAVKYLKCQNAVLYVERHNALEYYALQKGTDKTMSGNHPQGRFGFGHNAGDRCALPDEEGEYVCCASGQTISGEKYGLYVISAGPGSEELMHPLYFNVFKLYIENTLLRERILYENEHDQLTGLYNDGKFDEMLRDEFPSYEKISVFFFDVNYLKRTNDTRGHQFGSKLIVKAADSIKTVCGEDVFGFRMGGDEFIVVARNADEEKAGSIRKTWETALERSNLEDTDLECVVACGVMSASRPYDIKSVLAQADKLMYEDKRRIKIARGEDPDSR